MDILRFIKELEYRGKVSQFVNYKPENLIKYQNNRVITSNKLDMFKDVKTSNFVLNSSTLVNSMFSGRHKIDKSVIGKYADIISGSWNIQKVSTISESDGELVVIFENGVKHIYRQGEHLNLSLIHI